MFANRIDLRNNDDKNSLVATITEGMDHAAVLKALEPTTKSKVLDAHMNIFVQIMSMPHDSWMPDLPIPEVEACPNHPCQLQPVEFTLSMKKNVVGVILLLMSLFLCCPFLNAQDAGKVNADHVRLGLEAWLDRHYDVAIKHLTVAAQSSDVTAQYNLGMIYSGLEHPDAIGHNISGLHPPTDLAKAESWLRKAVANTDPSASARRTVVRAAFGLAGVLSRRNAYQEAARWLKKAADGGSAEAMSNLGAMYRTGQGVKQDNATALKYLTAADEAGSQTAGYHIGMIYYEGSPKDYKAASQWFTRAAQRGDSLSIQFLGLIAFEENNKTDAYKWFSLAAENDREMIEYRDAVAKYLSPAELSEARAAITTWKATRQYR